MKHKKEKRDDKINLGIKKILYENAKTTEISYQKHLSIKLKKIGH